MNQGFSLGIQGPRFWIIRAAISGFGTLSSLRDVLLAKPLDASAPGFGTLWLGGRPIHPKSTRRICSYLHRW